MSEPTEAEEEPQPCEVCKAGPDVPGGTRNWSTRTSPYWMCNRSDECGGRLFAAAAKKATAEAQAALATTSATTTGEDA